jgi:hypothetical protein
VLGVEDPGAIYQLKREAWNEAELIKWAKTDPVKTALATPFREETTVTMRRLARRLQVGTCQTHNAVFYRRRKDREQVSGTVCRGGLDFLRFAKWHH